ncbi:MAG TPA: hypothetical protein VGE08_05975 [Steroidobacter sp.]
MLVIKARVPAEAGRMFIKAIEAACEELPEAETPMDVEAVACLAAPTRSTSMAITSNIGHMAARRSSPTW